MAAVVVADVFPDTDQVAATALASVNWGRTTGTKTLSFTLDEETTLLLGWVSQYGRKERGYPYQCRCSEQDS